LEKIYISGKALGSNKPTFVIAEVGVNHDGNIGLAKAMIEEAALAGADAVKFQTFLAAEMISRNAPMASYQKRAIGDKESQFERLRRLELNIGDHLELKSCCEARDVMFLSSPFDIKSIDLLDELGVPAFKIPSGEITNYPFLKHMASKKKPMILSTGMSTLEEVEGAIKIINSVSENLGERVPLVLMQCTSSYPCPFEEANLRALVALERSFGLPVGLSDHTVGPELPVAACALGAVIIEKHFTLDRNLPGGDQRVSLEPNEFRWMVDAIRHLEKALGDGIKKVESSEEEIRRLARKSIVAKKPIRAGTVLTEEMLALKRPGTGLEPSHLDKLIGRKAKADIAEDELISWDMI
jgi:N,N'-diacetyllegionaminate synthase